MDISTGFIVVIGAMAFFYLRIAILRGQKKRFIREYALKRRKVNGRSKGAALPTPQAGTPPYGVNNWFLVAICVLLVLAGLIMYNNMIIFGINLIADQAFVDQYAEFWYIPVAAGVILLAFCIKIDKPNLDED